MHSALIAVVMLAAALGVGGCTLPGGQPDPDDTFQESLEICRFQHAGAANRKATMPATEDHVAACLARRGWTPSGARLTPPRP